MKCPIFSKAIRVEYGNNPLYGCDCLQEECAWWDETHGVCSVKAASKTLVAIGNCIGKLADIVHCDVQVRR